MISTDSRPHGPAEHEGDQFTSGYDSCWRDNTHSRQQEAVGVKGQPQVWRSAYHDNKALGKPATTRQAAGGGGGLQCKRGRGRSGGGAGRSKFRPTRAATRWVDNLPADDSNNKVVNCHGRSLKAATTTTKTTITTKKTTSRRQAHNVCTQRFKHDRWLVAAAAVAASTEGKGGKRAVAAAGATATDCDNKLRQRDPHRRGFRRSSSSKASHYARCDNNNLYHHYQHHLSSLSYRQHSKNHRPLAPTTTSPIPVLAEGRAAYQPRRVLATGRQLRASYCCSSLGHRSEGEQQSIGAAAVAAGSSRSASLPMNSAEPPSRLLAKTTTRTTRITTPPAVIMSRTASNSSNHRPLHSCLSYPQVAGRQSQVGLFVVALPFAWASSASSPQAAVVRLESRGSRSSSLGGVTSNRPLGQCRSIEAAEHDPATTTNVQDDVQESTSESVTGINCKSTLSMKPKDHKTTMTSSKPSMTSNTNDHPVAVSMGTQSSRATSHNNHHQYHHHRANNWTRNNFIKPLVPRHNNKPLLETPSTPPIISTMQQPTARRVHQQQQQRSNASSKRGPNESLSQFALHNQRGPSSFVPQRPDSPALSKTGRDKGNSPDVSKHSDAVTQQVAAHSPATAQDSNNNKFLDELQSNVHSLESVGQRARMAISIYDPLPAQDQQEHGEECHAEQERPSAAANRPTILDLNGTSEPAGNMSLGPRRRPPRRRESHYGDRFLKSPTIPEEPSELSALGDDELAALSQQIKLDSTSSRVTKRQDEGNNDSMAEGFLVATIEPEWGGVSKTLIVHSNATIESLTQDVLKKLIEIEHDQQSSIRARMRDASDVRPKERSTTGRKTRAAISDMNKLQELECEAEKLAKMFKQQLEIQQQQRVRESSMTFHADGDSNVQQKCDPTAMNRDEQARFFDPDHKPNERHKPKCDDKNADNGTGDVDQDGDCKSAFDFRCSCCCLHLVNQPKRADGETWCCCGCS